MVHNNDEWESIDFNPNDEWQPVSLEKAEHPFIQGIATTFGYNDKEDNGIGAWGDATNNPEIKGVSLPISVLKERFGDENKAHRKLVEVRNPETGVTEVLPIVDKGPADWVVARQGNTIDLTHAANQALGGSGKTAMEWRFLDDDEEPSAISAAYDTTPPQKQETKWTDYLPRVSGLGGGLAATTISIPALEKDDEWEVVPPPKIDPNDEWEPVKNLDIRADDEWEVVPESQINQSVENQKMINLPAKDKSGISKAFSRIGEGNESGKYLENVYANVWENGLDESGPKPWEEIQNNIPQQAKENQGSYWLSAGLLDAVEQIPQMFRSGPDVAKNALLGGTTGAALAGWLGQVGPQALTPEEAFTVPAGFFAGARIGAGTGAAEYWRKIGTASMYDSMRREGIPNEIAKPIAETLGVPYSALEFLQVSHFVPVAARRAVGKELANSIKSTLGNLTKETGKEYGLALSQEVMQDLIAHAGTKIGEIQSGIESSNKESVGDKIWNTIKQAAIPVAFLMGPKVAIDAATAIGDFNKSVPDKDLRDVSLKNDPNWNQQQINSNLADEPVSTEKDTRGPWMFKDYRENENAIDRNIYAVDPYQRKLDNLVGKKTRKRQLEESAKKNPSISEQTKQYLGTDYFQLSNEQTIKAAKESLVGRDLTEVFLELRDAPLNPLTIAQTLETANNLRIAGRDLEAADLILTASEKSTRAGQTVQALKFLSLLDANGIQMLGAKTIKEVASIDPIIKQRYDQIIRITGEVTEATASNADAAVKKPRNPKSKPETSKERNQRRMKVAKDVVTDFSGRLEGLFTKPESKLWNEYKDKTAKNILNKFSKAKGKGKAALQEFTSRLKKVIEDEIPKDKKEKTPKLNNAGVIREILNNPGRHEKMVREMQQQAQEKYADNPEALQEINDFTEQLLNFNPITSPQLVQNTVKETMKDLNYKIRGILTSTKDYRYARHLIQKTIESRTGATGQDLSDLSSAITMEFQRMEKEYVPPPRKSAIREKVDRRIGVDQYSKSAANQIAKHYGLSNEAAQVPALQEFFTRLVSNLKTRHRAAGQSSKNELSPGQLIGESIRNKEKYKSIWDETKSELLDLYGNTEHWDEISSVINDVMEDPYSAVMLNNAINESMNALDMDMKNILISDQAHKDTAKRKITSRILEHSQVSGHEAEMLANDIWNQFEALQFQAKNALLTQMTRTSQGKTQVPSKIQKLMDLNNAGLLSDQRFYKELSRIFDTPAWTSEMSQRIGKLQEEFSKETDPDMQLYRGTKMLSVIQEGIPKDILTQASTLQNIVMLLNPTTSMRNLIGNGVMWGFNGAADLVSIPADIFAQQVLTKKRSVNGLAIKAKFMGLAQPGIDLKKGYESGILKGMNQFDAVKQAIDYMTVMGQLTGKNKWQISDVKKMNAEVFSNKWLKLSEKALGLSLGAADRMFAVSAYKSSIERQMAAARSNGVDMTVPTPEMVVEAQMDAQKAIYQDPNFISASLLKFKQFLNKFSTGHEEFGLANVFGFLFTQVPGSIGKRVMEFSPLEFWNTACKLKDLYLLNKAGLDTGITQKQFAESFGKAFVGSSAIALGWFLSKMGIISSAPDENADVERMRSASGSGKYLVNQTALSRWLTSGALLTPQQTQPGDILYPYDWIQPMALPVAMGASAEQFYVNTLKNNVLNQNVSSKRILTDWEKIVQAGIEGGKFALSSLETFEDLSFMTGLANIAKNSREGIFEGVALSAMDFPQTFIPSFVKSINNYVNSKYFGLDTFETRGGDIFEQSKNRLLSKIPLVSENTQVPKMDVFGQAQLKYGYSGNHLLEIFLSPTYAKKASEDPAIREVNRIFSVTQDRSVVPKQADKSIFFKHKGRKMKLDLTNQEIANYQRFVGDVYLDFVYNKMQDPKFSELPAIKKADIMGEKLSKIGQYTKKAILRKRGYELKEQADKLFIDQAEALKELGAFEP